MNKRFRRLRMASLALALSVILPLSGCGTSEVQGDVVRVALPGGPNVSLPQVLISEGTGEFERQGIGVDFQQFATGVDALAALSGGSVDVAAVGGLDVIRSAAAGNDLVGVFGPLRSAGGALVASTALKDSHGTDIKKFADAQWGYAKEGTTSMRYMRTVAEKQGLNWDQISRGALGSQMAMVAAMRAERVDLVSMDTTTAAKAVTAEFGYVVLNTSDPDATEQYWGPQLGSVFLTSRTFAREHPDLLQKFVSGMVGAQKQINDVNGDTDAVFAMLPDELQLQFGDYFEVAWELTSPGVTGLDGSVSDEQIANTVDWALGAGALSKEDAELPPTSEFIDNSYVENALKQLSKM